MTKPKAEGKGRGGDGRSFEKALAELESIVSEMEGGRLGLDDMIQRFEKGQELVKFCTVRLNEVERKIEILVKQGDAVTAQPFDDGADPGEPADSAAEADGDEGADGGGRPL